LSTTTAIQPTASTVSKLWTLRGCACVFAIALFVSLFAARHIPLVHDAPLMNYVVFLMSKGMIPYREIVDMNMPGTYLLQMAQIHAFGPSSSGRIAWDFLTIAIVILASTRIAGSAHRATGVLAGCASSLIHLSGGPWDIGQRDWNLAVLLLVACVFLVEFGRSGRGIWVFGAFLAAGIATSIKPTGILFPVAALVLVSWKRRTSRSEVTQIVISAVAGLLLPAAVVAAFLVSHRAIGSFVSVLKGLVPYYASLAHVSITNMAWHLLSAPEKLLLLIALACFPLCIIERGRHALEWLIVSVGVGCGAASYLLQAKGWAYHRAPLSIFLCLWVMMAIDTALNARRASVRTAALVLIMSTLLLPPMLLALELNRNYPLDTIQSLEHDMQSMGGSRLSRHVQCLDMTLGGCINVLYRLHLVQSTGFIYDFYLFPDRPTPVTAALQTRFLSEVTASPPRVLILSQHIWPDERLGYDEVRRWPAFEAYLASHYRLAREYMPPSRLIAGYRIYLLR
jgi:hypothetical protein